MINKTTQWWRESGIARHIVAKKTRKKQVFQAAAAVGPEFKGLSSEIYVKLLSDFLSFVFPLSFPLPVVLSCFCSFSVSFSLSLCIPWSLVQGSVLYDRAAVDEGQRAAGGLPGRSGDHLSPHLQHTSPVQYDPAVPSSPEDSSFSVSFSLSVSLILCLLDADRQKNTHV